MIRELFSLGFRNVPEILILAALIFGLLYIVRGTKGESMLKGLAAVLAIPYIFVRGFAWSSTTNT